jgi:hypothetical protein
MNLVGGTTDMIHGLSGLFAYLIDRVARVGVHDAALRPIYMTLVVIRDVSGAVADASARLSTDFLDQTHVSVRVRSPRVLAPNGALLVHGPARDPREGQLRRENKAVSKLVRWYRHVASMKSAGTSGMASSTQRREELHKLLREKVRRHELGQNQDGMFSMLSSFYSHVTAAREEHNRQMRRRSKR